MEADLNISVVLFQFILTLKHINDSADAYLALLVMRRQQEYNASNLVHNVTVLLKQSSFRMLLDPASTVSVIFDSLEVTQAYFWSVSKLHRKIFKKADVLSFIVNILFQLVKPVGGLTKFRNYRNETFHLHQKLKVRSMHSTKTHELLFKNATGHVVGVSDFDVYSFLFADTNVILKQLASHTPSHF